MGLGSGFNVENFVVFFIPTLKVVHAYALYVWVHACGYVMWMQIAVCSCLQMQDTKL